MPLFRLQLMELKDATSIAVVVSIYSFYRLDGGERLAPLSISSGKLLWKIQT